MTMRLFGTTTSPYVRRVRIVALELRVPFELVDVFAEAGQAAMRQVNPLWKVPTVELDGRAIFDSRVINEQLMRQHGPGPLAPLSVEDVEVHNVLTVIDGALDALVNTFYLARDGVGSEQAAYVAKQRDRAAAAMAWLDARIDDGWLTRARVLGLPEIALCTTLEWMRFRDTYPVERHPALLRCLEHHEARESLVATRPSS